jgi:hypothetical protein
MHLRIRTLEDCVERMSSTFMNLTDDVLKEPQVLQQNPGIAQLLLRATSRIVSLAQIATLESDSEDQSEVIRSRDSARIDEKLFLTVPQSKTESTSVFASDAVPDSLGTSPNNPKPKAISSRVTKSSDTAFSLQDNGSCPGGSRVPEKSFENVYARTNIFGNGWFGRRPLLPAINFTTGHPKMERNRDDSMSFRLVQITLSIGYECLLGDVQNPTARGLEIFHYALPHHSREELLFNLRWFLGPGVSDLQYLAHAVVGLNKLWTNITSFPRAFGPSHILCPSVDISAQQLEGDVMNAHELEEYLRTIGISHMNQDAVELYRPDEGLQTNDVMSPSYFHRRNSNSYELEPNRSRIFLTEGTNLSSSNSTWPDATDLDSPYRYPTSFPSFNSTSLVPSFESPRYAPQEQQTGRLIARPNIWKVFDFNALFDESAKPSFAVYRESTQITSMSNIMGQRIGISVPILVHKLTRIALCLGNGPAYPRGSVEDAIMSSVIDVADHHQ